MHTPDELGRGGAGGDGGARDPGNPPGVGIRARGAILFLLGFLFGALSLYYLLWRTGGLSTGHFATLTTGDIAGATRVGTPAPLPTIPPGTTPMATVRAVEGDQPSVTSIFSVVLTPTPAVRFFSTLDGRTLAMPVVGARTMDLRDNFHEARGSRRHDAIDVLAPRGTPVVAVDEGRVVKLFTSQQGGLTVYQFDKEEKHCYYYAHLDRYAEGLHEGAYLDRGDPIGHVGTTGNAPKDTPHLHFAIFELGPEKRWWEGKPINPYPFLIKVK